MANRVENTTWTPIQLVRETPFEWLLGPWEWVIEWDRPLAYLDDVLAVAPEATADARMIRVAYWPQLENPDPRGAVTATLFHEHRFYGVSLFDTEIHRVRQQ